VPPAERLDLPIVVRGTVEGRILLPHECADPAHPERGRGTNGFGYDPLFQLPNDHPRFPGKTTAELSPDDKNSLSHRGQAARLLWEHLRPHCT
jgi:XTP/dITP diphosphohydrolase